MAIENNSMPEFLTKAQCSVIEEPVPAELVATIEGHKYVNLMVIVKLLNKAFGYAWSFKVINFGIEQAKVTKTGGPGNPAYYCWVLGELTYPVKDPGTGATVWVSKQAFGGKPIVGSNNSKLQSNDYKAAASDALKKAASLTGFASNVYCKDELLDAMTALESDEWNSINQQRYINEATNVADIKRSLGDNAFAALVKDFCDASGDYTTYGSITPSNIVNFLAFANDKLSAKEPVNMVEDLPLSLFEN